MKRFLFGVLASLALGLAAGGGVAVAQYATSNYMAAGGSAWNVGGTLTVASGGTQTVASGGILDIASGGALKIAGTDVTAILATSPAAVAAGYKIARGETALDGSNPTPVTTGLATITGCATTIKTTSAPGVSTSVVTYDTSSGTMNLYGWKVTNSSTTTLIASTGTDTIGWVCVGT